MKHILIHEVAGVSWITRSKTTKKNGTWNKGIHLWINKSASSKKFSRSLVVVGRVTSRFTRTVNIQNIPKRVVGKIKTPI